MEDFIETYGKKLSSKPIWWCFAFGMLAMFAIAIVFCFFLGLVNFWNYILTSLGLLDEFKEEIGAGQFYRNRGFFTAGIVGFILTVIGMGLTFWGRVQTQKQTKQAQKQIEQSHEQLEFNRKSNTDERYENAARMLGDDVSTVRIAGCHALRSLGIEDSNNFDGRPFDIDEYMEVKTIATQCMDLLLAYICNPYLDNKQKEEIKKYDDSWDRERVLENLFPLDKPLEADIQAAADAISALHNHCSMNRIDLEDLKFSTIILPSYFWRNIKKNSVALPFATLEKNLQGAHLEGADLFSAWLLKCNLQGADLKEAYLLRACLKKAVLRNAHLVKVDFEEVDLEDADMTEANLSGARLRHAENLTKEQILSAKWGYCHYDNSNKLKPLPPELPEELLKDKEIKDWLKKPHYGKYDYYWAGHVKNDESFL